MTVKVFQKCKMAWKNNSLRILSIGLFCNYKTIRSGAKTFYRNIVENNLVRWDDNSITFRYRAYPNNEIREVTIHRKYIKYIKMFNDNELNYYYTRTRNYR